MVIASFMVIGCCRTIRHDKQPITQLLNYHLRRQRPADDLFHDLVGTTIN